MKDYTIAPTSEFQRKKDSPFHGGIMGWLTLQKAVMNDYYFDPSTFDELGYKWADEEFLDQFMHKIYFCWQEAMRIHVDQIEGGLTE